MGRAAENLTGRVFGRLTVVGREENKNNRTHWHCNCDCGQYHIARASNLKSGNTKSCGCLQKESIAAIGRKTKKHGMSGGRTYSSWKSMKTRCSNPSRENYSHYGGRGISVCPEWINSFEQFYRDLGERPEGTSIDRINNDSNYSPENCRWVDSAIQRNNRRDCL